MNASRAFVGSLAVALFLLCLPATAQDYRAELKELQPKIDAAIDQGVKWLLEQQLPDGSWGGRHSGMYPNGETALAVYTLLKSGLPASHRAVDRGLDWLKRHEPTRTYSIACQMLAYEATKDPSYQGPIRVLLKSLLRLQENGGGFSYPGPPAPRPDLSNTQYGALGMRAAMLAGVRVPTVALERLVDCALDYQGPERAVRLPPDPVMEVGQTGKDKDGYDRTPSDKKRNGYAAGFGYLRGKSPTGSMSVAGMGILLIARDCWGDKLPLGQKNRIRKAVELGLNWLRSNWSVAENLGQPGAWHLYYLYGLERVGSLLMQEVIAGHAWYLEGAKHLTSDRKQDKNGNWKSSSGPQSATCFALLFLKRATWVGRGVTGKRADKDANPVASHASQDGDVRLRGHGEPRLALWVDGFSPSILEKWKAGRKNPDIRVLRVAYFVNGEEVAVVQGDPARRWKGETFAAQQTITEPGTYSITARVELLPPGTKRHHADVETVVVESGPMSLEIARTTETDGTEMERALAGNVVPEARVRAKASSEAGKGNVAGLAIDGREATRWLCDEDDRRPRLTLRLRKPQSVRHLMISQNVKDTAKGRGHGGAKAARRVAIHVNGSRLPTLVTELRANQPTHIALPEELRVKSLLIELLDRASGESGRTGISEIYLYR